MSVFFEMSILIACLLTVLIEVPFLALFGYRDRYAVTVTVCANVVTNLTLNLSLHLFLPPTWAVVLLAESLVVAVETLIYSAAFRPSARLFLLTLCANLLSFGLGLLIF